jgi:riboflavin kinase/FMN adenylyltransferase
MSTGMSALMTPRLVCLDLRGERIHRMRTLPPPAVLCLGNFDGVHLAHAALIRRGRELAHAIRARRDGLGDPETICGVFCFFHPSGDYFLPPDTLPTHLTTLKERIEAIRNLGVDAVWLCNFPTVKDLAPTDFLKLLQTDCHAVGAVCGYNHRFGKQAAGSPALLENFFGAESVAVLPAMEMDGIPVSSTRIRTCLYAGDVETAQRLLGRPYSLESRVLHGKSLGHIWGFPTANQNFPADRIIPAHGVYAVTCYTPKGVYPGVANVGLRPTVEYHARLRRVNCETHIIGFSGDIYDQIIRVEFRKFLRPERRFDSVDDLKAAIRRDTEAADAYIRARFSELLT